MIGDPMTAEPTSVVSADLASVAVRSIHAMADGERAIFDPLYASDAVGLGHREGLVGRGKDGVVPLRGRPHR
jgi:hypothetical protein